MKFSNKKLGAGYINKFVSKKKKHSVSKVVVDVEVRCPVPFRDLLRPLLILRLETPLYRSPSSPNFFRKSST